MAASTDGAAAQSAGLVGITRQPHCGTCPARTGPSRAEISCGAGAGVQGYLAKEGSILEHFQPVVTAFGTDGPLVGRF